MLLSEIKVDDRWLPVSVGKGWIVDITDIEIIVSEHLDEALFGDEVLELIDKLGVNFDCKIVKE